MDKDLITIYNDICDSEDTRNSIESAYQKAEKGIEKIKNDFIEYIGELPVEFYNFAKEKKDEKERELKKIDGIISATKTLFSKVLFQTYDVICKFENDKIEFEKSKEYNTKLNIYRNVLNRYVELLYQKGFQEESDFNQLNENYQIICEYIKLLDNLINCIQSQSTKYLDKTSCEVLIEVKIDYEKLKDDYEKFFIILRSEASHILNNNVIEYILENTSLLPLVYANNGDNNIKRLGTLKPTFICQIHKEKTPSMRVLLIENIFNCFGCGHRGNQIYYLMLKENITYDEAIYLLAEIYLIDIPGNPFKKENLDLVIKYRNTIISNELVEFLTTIKNRINSNLNFNNTSNTKEDFENWYWQQLSQITRIKTGESDPNFVYQERSEKYKCSKPIKLSKVPNPPKPLPF